MSRNVGVALCALAVLIGGSLAIAQQAIAPPAGEQPVRPRRPLAEPLKPYTSEEDIPGRQQAPVYPPASPVQERFAVTSIGDGSAILLDVTSGKTWILRLSEGIAWLPIEYRFNSAAEVDDWRARQQQSR
jgi:hypothetical protein